MTRLTTYNPALLAYPAQLPDARFSEPALELREPVMPSLLGAATAIYLLSVVTLSYISDETAIIPQLIGVGLGILWLVAGVVVKGQPIIWSRPITYFILFTAWGATGTLVTIDADYFYSFFQTTLKVMVVTWLALQCVRTRKDFLACCLLVAVASLIILAVDRDIILRAVQYSGKVQKARVTGTVIQNANELGSFGVLVCVMAVTCLLGYRSWLIRAFSVIPIIAALYIVAASGSRTAMVGLAAAAAGLYWYQFRNAGKGSMGRKVMLVILGAGVLAGTFYFLVVSPFFFRLKDVFSSSSSMQKEPRFQYFVSALEATKDSPLVGLGMGGFALNRLGIAAEGFGHYSHSSISETLSCTGVPGFLLFFGGRVAFYLLIRRARKLPLPAADFGTVNLIMTFFWVLIIFDIVSVTYYHRMMWPLEGAACGYLWNLHRQYGQPALAVAD